MGFALGTRVINWYNSLNKLFRNLFKITILELIQRIHEFLETLRHFRKIGGKNMNAKQIRWHVTVLAVTVIAVLAVLFALVTVTSNAASPDIVDDGQGNRTITMSDSTYDEQIVLAENTTTTIDISGNNNKLTYGSVPDLSSYPCIKGKGNLKITGNGTLDVTRGCIKCNDFTVGEGVTLIVRSEYGLEATGNVTVKKAALEFKAGYIQCGSSKANHVFNNARLETSMEAGLIMYGNALLEKCDVKITNGAIIAISGTITIDGGNYIITQNEANLNPGDCPSLDMYGNAIIKNAVIKTNSICRFQDLDMIDSDLGISISQKLNVSQYPALDGYNLKIAGSKINIEGSAEGIIAFEDLIICDDSDVNIKGKYFGIFGKNVQIIHSGGKIETTDAEATAAVSAIELNMWSGALKEGTLSLKAADVKEPAGSTIGKVYASIKPDIISPATGATITAILDGKDPAKTVIIQSGHNWVAGEVIKQPTETAEGIQKYTCDICGETKTEAIPKLAPQDSQESSMGVDGTPFGKGASVEAAEAAILALPDDNDPAGTAFGLLQLKATKVTKNSIKLNWKAVPGANRYIIFANKCGTGNKYKKLGVVTGTSLNVTQAAGAALKKGTYYKFMMIAADANGKVVSTSKTVHAATKGGKVGNHKKVTVKKSVTKKAKKLKKGKTLKLKAKAVPQAKKLKVKKHRAIKYESSNPAVAQVNGKGAVKGVGKGTCYIYAYAQNGTSAKVKVTVK